MTQSSPRRVEDEALRPRMTVWISDAKLQMRFENTLRDSPEFPLATVSPEGELDPEKWVEIQQWAACRPDPGVGIDVSSDQYVSDESRLALAAALGLDSLQIWVPHPAPMCSSGREKAGTERE